jgi:signal transduction histidine kinase
MIGYVQFSSNRSWSVKSKTSNALIRDLNVLSREFETLEKTVRSHKVKAYSVEMDKFIESKSRIQNQVDALKYYVDKTELNKSGLDSLTGLSNTYLSFYQNLLLEKFQSENREIWLDNQLNLVDLGLVSYLMGISRREREAMDNLSLESYAFWETYFFTSMGLVMFLFGIGFLSHRYINSEFNTCDEAILRDKIYQEIFEHAEKIAGLGHGFYNFNVKKFVFSSNLYRILGYQPNAFSPSFRNYLKQVHPEDRRKVVEAFKSLSLTNDKVQTDCRVITPSGELKYVDVLAIFKIENKERIVIFVNRDATAHKASSLQLLDLNQDLTLQNRMFKHVEKIASIGYFSADFDNETVNFSENLFRMLGFQPNSFKVSKEMLLSFVVEEDKLLLSNWLDPESDDGDLINLPVRFRTFYGEIKFISLSREFFTDKGNILLVTLKDVTTEALVNQKLEIQNEELFRSNAELASFNYIASHDLQEPLRKIQTFISLFYSLEGLNLNEKAKDYLFRIQRSANRMQLLILDLLQFSRISKTDKVFEMADLNLILQNALDELVILIEENESIIQISELPVAEVIPHQILQLLKNLVGNAVKFSIPGIPNTIQIKTEDLTDQELGLFPSYVQEDLIKITVIDSGIGFEQSHAESIFLIFKRLHDKFEFPGTGIGLSICQRIIENHNGRIYAQGNPGKGAKFTFIIPRSQHHNVQNELR